MVHAKQLVKLVKRRKKSLEELEDKAYIACFDIVIEHGDLNPLASLVRGNRTLTIRAKEDLGNSPRSNLIHGFCQMLKTS